MQQRAPARGRTRACTATHPARSAAGQAAAARPHRDSIRGLRTETGAHAGAEDAPHTLRCGFEWINPDGSSTMAQAIRLHQVSPLKASCHQCSLSNLCLPLAIEENDLDRLEDIVQQGKIYNRGEHIFDQSTPVRSCFAVKSGSIKTSIITEGGEEQVTGFFMPGELVGLDSMSSENYACTAKALERTSVCEFPAIWYTV